MIPVAPPPPQHRADVAVDGLDLPEGDLLVAVAQDTVQMPRQHSAFSDHYGVWFSGEEREWYGDDVGDPSRVTERKFCKELGPAAQQVRSDLLLLQSGPLPPALQAAPPRDESTGTRESHYSSVGHRVKPWQEYANGYMKNWNPCPS